MIQSRIVATVPTACGIETKEIFEERVTNKVVATVPTACGIETNKLFIINTPFLLLQQCLPLAVLKLVNTMAMAVFIQGCNSAYRLRY